MLTLLFVVMLYPEPKAGNGHNIVIQTDTIIKRDTIKDVPGEPKYTSKQPVGTAEVRVPTDRIKMVMRHCHTSEPTLRKAVMHRALTRTARTVRQ